VSRAALVALPIVAGILAVGALLLSIGGKRTWTAEFANARGLVVGNDVRVGGAIAGRVTSIRLSRAGRALVGFSLDDAAAAPRADAAAAIRPVDLLGDAYLSLTPGSARTPLRGPIAAAHTTNAPRLDEVLDTFSPRVREGLRTLLIEAGLALDGRGGDLNRAIVALRPAVAAADADLRELNGQDQALARVVPAAERVVAQLDGRRQDIGRALDGLARALDATAGESGALDRALAGAPATLASLRSTAAQLGTTAHSARPVAARLAASAPALSAAVQDLPGLLARVRGGAPGLAQGLRAARTALAGGRSSVPRLATALPQLRALSPVLDSFLGELDTAMPGIAEGFLVDFPDQAAEPGTQPFDPFADKRRGYWRGAAVFSCEAFGVPVRKGCLTEVLGGGGPRRERSPALKVPAAPKPAVPALPIPKVTVPVQPPVHVGGPAGHLLDYLLGP
jgi:ABC-type transporter Mla subunit MlaD